VRPGGILGGVGRLSLNWMLGGHSEFFCSEPLYCTLHLARLAATADLTSILRVKQCRRTRMKRTTSSNSCVTPAPPRHRPAEAYQELRQLQTVRASFEILKGYADVIAASVEATLDNFTAVNGMSALSQEEEESSFGSLTRHS
jgi:hypothetical protein